MDNAVQNLKDISNFLTLSSEEDGISYAVEKFVILSHELNFNQEIKKHSILTEKRG